MDVMDSQRQFIEYMTSLYREGYLDDQFIQLQKLEDESSPSFVKEIITLFFQDSDKLTANMGKAFEQHAVDFIQISNHAHQLKGSSSNVGANKIKNICGMFRGYCEERNYDACLACFKNLQQEYSVLKTKFIKLFELEDKIIKNGGTIPTMD